MISMSPIHSSEFEYKAFMKNVHGHVHTNSIKDSRYINVCCENVGYKPILIEDLFGFYQNDL